MKTRYEYRTIRTGVEIDPKVGEGFEFIQVIEIVNMQPDREQFRALVKVEAWDGIEPEVADDGAHADLFGDGIHFEDVPMKWSDEAIAAMDAEPGVFGQEEE